MTQFFLGFFSAIAVLAVTVIVWAVVVYRRQERQRQAAVDAIMAKVALGTVSVNEARRQAPSGWNESQRIDNFSKKGIH